jgi:PAS domain S-box-containing protein
VGDWSLDRSSGAWLIDAPGGKVLAAAPWLLREVIAQAPVGVALFDADLRYVEVNERLAEMNGCPVEAHVGRRPEELLPGLPVESYVPVARRALDGEATEAVEISGETRARPGVMSHFLESWAPVRSPDGQVVGVLAFVVETTDRRRAEAALHERERRDRVRAEALAELAGVMAAATRVDELAAAIADRAAAAAGAAFSNLALLSDDGRALRLHHHGSLDARIVQRWREVSLSDAVPLVDAVRNLKPVFVRDPEMNARLYPMLAADTTRSGFSATASIPLIGRGGAAIGAIGFAWRDPQQFASELRAVLTTIAQLTSQSLERARLHEAEEAARRRATILADVTTAISAPQTTRDRLDRLCERLVPAFADEAVADLPDDATGDGPAISTQCASTTTDGFADLLEAWAHDAAPAGARLVSDTHGPIPDEAEARAATALRELGVGSYVMVPVRARGAVIGWLALGQTESGRRFNAADLAFAVDLGERIGLIVETGRLVDAEHEIASELQQRLLPAALVAPQGTAVAARYRAGHARLGIGGDWYEVVGRADGRVVIAVGDIVGHGARAAAAMGQVRSALTATAGAADGPTEVLTRLEDFAQRTPDVQHSTVCVLFLDPATGDLRYASAGHPPPALLSPDGHAELLQGGRSWPLCAIDSRNNSLPPRREARAQMPVGARLLLYTDGLIERRDASLDVGLARLVTALANHSRTGIEPLCDALLADLLAETSREDDAAVLCVARVLDAH